MILALTHVFDGLNVLWIIWLPVVLNLHFDLHSSDFYEQLMMVLCHEAAVCFYVSEITLTHMFEEG